jgi:hypothetical protein
MATGTGGGTRRSSPQPQARGEKAPAEVTAAYSQAQAVARRLSVNVALDVADAIDELAKRHGTTITDVIRRAVSVYKYIDDETAYGAKILVERNGTIREVKFL